MTEAQIKALGPALADFLDQFLFCCGYTQTFELLGVYCHGLLSDLDRKTCEPIALAAGVAVRTLQEFLRDHLWDHDQVRQLLQGHVAQRLAQVADDGLGSVGLADETGTVKKGSDTPGVQRQYCGEVGKIENCIVTVHLGVARAGYKTLLDADLFLPQSWSHDRPRCRQAGIPDRVVYRPKWQISLEQLDRATGHGLRLDWMTFDEGYGSKPGYLRGLENRQVRYVGEVPKSFRCCGRRPDGRQRSSRADELVRHSPLFYQQAWQVVRLNRQTLGPVAWHVQAAQVYWPWDRTRTYWLIWAVNRHTGEEKYFVSNAPADAALATLLRVGFSRWNVEHSFRVSKSEIGLRHYEGRNYQGLMRHLVLCQLMLTFVADQTERLRGEKSGGDAGAGVSGREQPLLGLAGSVAGDDTVAVHGAGHRLSPAA